MGIGEAAVPKKRYEEEIEEILEKMDSPDARTENERVKGQTSAESEVDPKDGRLISWEEVPESRPEPLRPRRGRRRQSSRTSSIVITPTRLIVAAVIVVIFILATKIWPLMIVAVLLFGGAYFMNKRRGGPGLLSGTRQGRYWRGSPIDFEDEESDDRDGSDSGGGTSGGNRWRGGEPDSLDYIGIKALPA